MVLPDVAFDHVHCRSNVFATVESKPVPIALHNARHERFAQGLAEGKTQAQAYIDAGFSPKNARANASALLQNNPGIVERREQLLRTRAQCNFAVVSGIAVQEHCTLEAHLATLAQLRDEAQAKGDYSSAVSAEYKRGQALGFPHRAQGTRQARSVHCQDAGEADKQWQEVIAKIAAKQAIRKSQARPRDV